MVSNCCGALPMGETHDDLGFCSECKEHAEFKETPEDDYFKDIQQDRQENKMKDSRFYFLLGWGTAMLLAGFIVGCTATPLEAGGSECGSTEWNPCYVKIVD